MIQGRRYITNKDKIVQPGDSVLSHRFDPVICRLTFISVGSAAAAFFQSENSFSFDLRSSPTASYSSCHKND